MAIFIGFNSPLSTTTNVDGGTSYASGAKTALQLQIPASGRIKLLEWGVSMNGSAAATPATLEVATTDTATTMSTAHTTTTIESIDHSGVESRLTMGTTGTGYGNASIASNTTLRPLDRQFVAPTSQYVKIWVPGREPVIGSPVGSSSSESFLQFRINTSATVTAIIYAVWEEYI